MRKVFWDNPYQHQLNTVVTAVEGNRILFNETIAYSFSGGQESDKTSINGLPVLDSEMVGKFIYYTLQEKHGLSVGSPVCMEIDWTRRCRLMRLHFAAELILELVTQQIQAKKIGAHIAENKARIDFIYPNNIALIFDGILNEYNAIISNNFLIQTGFSDVETQQRYWEIEGFSKVSCGGTHVKSTAEVGYITLKRVNTGAGKERIEIRLVDDKIPLEIDY